MMKALFTEVTRSLVGLVGVGLTTVSAILFLTLFAIEELGDLSGPYNGIIAFVLLPAIFVVGLLLIPIGVWRVRRGDRRRAAPGRGPSARRRSSTSMCRAREASSPSSAP